MADLRDKRYGWWGNGIGWRDGDREEPAARRVAGGMGRGDENGAEREQVGRGERGEGGNGCWAGGGVGGELSEDAFGGCA